MFIFYDVFVDVIGFIIFGGLVVMVSMGFVFG